MRTRTRVAPKFCARCSVRPAWESNQLPICEPCFDPIPSAAKHEFWRARQAALLAANVQDAVRSANADLIRASRMIG